MRLSTHHHGELRCASDGVEPGSAVTSAVREPVSEPVDMRCRRARVRAAGVELAVQIVGPLAAAPVLLLHGFTGSSAAVSPLAQRLAGDHRLRVVFPDLVGHGRSEVPEDCESYRVESMARQVLGVSEHLELESFHLAGYSMGARVALAAACAEPRRLRSLTLIGAAPGIADDGQRRRRVEADEQRARQIESDLAVFVDEWMSNPLFAGQAALGDAHLREARRQRLASSPAGLARSLRCGGTGAMTALHDRLGDCDMPALLVAGALDGKFAAISESMAAAMPNAEVARIAGAGHAAHVERLDATATAIGDFITTVERCR